MSDPPRRVIPRNDIPGNSGRREYLADYQRVKPALVSLYTATIKDLAAEIMKAEQSGKVPPERLLSLRNSMYEAYTALVKSEEALIVDWMQNAVGSGVKTSYDAFPAAVRPSIVAPVVNTSLALSLAAGDVTSRFIYTGSTDGISLSDRIWSNIDRDFNRIFAQVQRGVLIGKSARSIAAEILKFSRDENHLGYTPWKSALRLARTEMAQAFRAGQIELYGRVPSVEYVEWDLSLSHRASGCRCEENAALDAAGQGPGIYPKDKVPPIPHPHCICFLRPVLSSDALARIGLTRADLAR